MKISEVTLEDVKNHCNIYIDDDDYYITKTIIPSSKAFIKSYTGLTNESIDDKEDLTLAFLILCADMYDNRHFVVNKSNLNPTAKILLEMHSINLL